MVLTRDAETGGLCLATSASSFANSSSPSQTDEADDGIEVMAWDKHKGPSLLRLRRPA